MCPPASYTVTLRFADLAVAQAGKRVMEITLEDTIGGDGAGHLCPGRAGVPLTRTYTVPVTDGQLNIDFAKIGGPGAEVPMVSAVAVAYAGPLPRAA